MTPGWLLFCTGLATSPATGSPYRVDYAWDGAATALALAGGLVMTLIEVDTEHTWASELLPFDESVKANFSSRSASLADALVLSATVIPLAAQLGHGVDEDLGLATLLYGEALGGTYLLNSAAKYLVQRPRPYVYNSDAKVQAYAAQQGADSRLSFFSGHAAMSFAAAVSGSYLLSLRVADADARATLWGVELALATATANFRVRAGKHFYSDVLVGAVVGAGVGFAVPYFHQKDRWRYVPTGREYAAMAGGVAAGALVSQLVPLDGDVTLPLAWRVLPLPLHGGLGVALTGEI